MSIARNDPYLARPAVKGPWTDVPPVPHKPVRAAIARALFRNAVGRLDLRVEMPDGSRIGRGGADAPLITIHRDAFFHRVGADALIGFGEAYVAGDWDADDPGRAMKPFAAAAVTLIPKWMQKLRALYVPRKPRSEENTLRGSRQNVSRHYDLSNELFAEFLDESMTYSSAIFGPGDSLHRAQLRKIDRLLDVTDVGPGTKVLEIGSGWGALAIRAARRGATVTTVTLSSEQQALARQRIREAGVQDRVDVHLCDYRDVEGTFDAVVSVEMIEAVGQRYWPTYFSTIDRLLAPGGRVGLQAIVTQHDRMLAARKDYTFVHKYIFPGGALPSLRAIDDTTRKHTELRVEQTYAFGLDYARTLQLWRERFDARSEAVDALGFDEAFRRMWDFYLAYAEAGFAAGYLDVVQIVLDRKAG
ncbi:MAG: Cyclopropane-fatty-acyl-phospholipid synthase [Actinomycetia bacterium]|nr:Cyclopropane-fatty-acyl-phospholipid synthase [Actinomycetes bacterium]